MSKLHLADAKLGWSPLNRPPTVVDRKAGKLQWDERTRVCIYGAGLGREEAPLDDEDWVVWALNLIPPLGRERRIRADLWWDIHQRCAQTEDDLRWIGDGCKVPIFVPPDLLDAGPNCVCFPVLQVERKTYPGPFACTFALQIAYAVMAGFKDIGLYGVELAFGTRRERTVEWASVNWWMGFAEAKGVRFHLPLVSRLGTHRYRYGLEYDAEIADVNDYLGLMKQMDDADAWQKKRRASVGG